MDTLHHDFETYCDLDITQVGLARYVRHPSFRILMCSYAVNDDAVGLWVPEEGEKMPSYLWDALRDPGCYKEAFNAPFEINATRYGVDGIEVPLEQYRCTMTRAYALAYFGPMSKVAKQIGIPEDQQKLETGSRLIQRFCKPAPKNHHADVYDRHSHPEEWEQFKDYCRQDTVTERAIAHHCIDYQSMSEEEWQVWVIDQIINERGFPVDRGACERALQLHEQVKARILEEMKAKTGLKNPNSLKQLDPWVRDRGVVMPNYQAETIDASIKLGTLPDDVVDVLKMKRRVGMTAPTKWGAYLKYLPEDNYLRGMLRYSGAGRTRRWASVGVNLQNLKQPPFDDMETAIWFINNMPLETIEAIYGDPIAFLAGTVRGGITAPDGMVIGVSDLSSIESYVVGWISDCHWINETFAQGLETYKRIGSRIFNVTYEEVTPKQRKFSKPVMLAGPYGQGAKGLVEYAEGFGVELTEAEAKKHIDTFRETCWEIPKMWKWLEQAIFDAIRLGTVHEGYKIRIYKWGCYLCIELPSGRRLTYRDPEIRPMKTPWGEIKPTFTYMGKHRDKPMWVRTKAHMGLITENIVQAIARDLLAHGLVRAYHEGVWTIGHVHDEQITLWWQEQAEAGLQKLIECMTDSPPWAQGLKLKADGFLTRNYRKD